MINGYRLLITLSSIMCIVALFEYELDLEYGYYQFLRWVVTAAAGIAAYKFHTAKLSVRAVICFLIAALFNPIKPIELDSDMWEPIDFAVAIVLPLLHGFKEHTKLLNRILLFISITGAIGSASIFYFASYNPYTTRLSEELETLELSDAIIIEVFADSQERYEEFFASEEEKNRFHDLIQRIRETDKTNENWSDAYTNEELEFGVEKSKAVDALVLGILKDRENIELAEYSGNTEYNRAEHAVEKSIGEAQFHDNIAYKHAIVLNHQRSERIQKNMKERMIEEGIIASIVFGSSILGYLVLYSLFRYTILKNNRPNQTVDTTAVSAPR